MVLINTKINVLIVVGLFAESYIRPTRGAFGIPDFLEFGQCFNATLVDGFDPVKYQGLWFSIQSVPNEYEHSRKCNAMNYTWIGDRMISVAKGVTDEGVKIKQVTELLEDLELREPPHPASMIVSAPGVPESPYEIISTDYVTYSCVHSCLGYFGFKGEFFWVLGRTPYLSRDYVEVCHDALSYMGADPTKLDDIQHGEFCPYTKKLEEMLEKSRLMMIDLGLLGEEAPPLASSPPHAASPTTVFLDDVNEKEFISEQVNQDASSSIPRISEDEMFSEELLGHSRPTEVALNSSAPQRTRNIVNPLFVLIAVVFPAVAR